MKAILQAAWLLTVACGSFIVIVVAESKLIANQVPIACHVATGHCSVLLTSTYPRVIPATIVLVNNARGTLPKVYFGSVSLIVRCVLLEKTITVANIA